MLQNLLNRLFNNSKLKELDKSSLDIIPMDKSKLTGIDFEFLITPSDIEIKAEDFDTIMTPDSISWTKTIKGDSLYYQVDTDEFSYSWEPTGIQMTFSKNINYDKAKLIADQVISKITKYTGKEIQLVFIATDKIIRFQ